MSEVPPFPNSVNAAPIVPKHQITKIEVEHIRASEINRKRDVVETFYSESRIYQKNGQFSTTTPKVSGQRILVTV